MDKLNINENCIIKSFFLFLLKMGVVLKYKIIC